MNDKLRLISVVSLGVVLLASGTGVTRSSFIDPGSSAGNAFQAWASTPWVQTSQADFEAGVLNQVDTSSSLGNVKLAAVSQEPTTSTGLEESWYFTSWSRRAPVTINNLGSGLTDYQVKVDVTYDADDMQSDFDDIRFVDSDDSTELSHWRESYTASASATFWVKVPSIPSGNKTIYMYYGNAIASSESSKENTMAIVVVEVAADADDGEEDGRLAGTHSWKASGYYSDNATFLGYAEPYDSPFEIAWRFDNIIASGKALDGCKIEIWHNDGHSESGTSDNATLYGIDEADPAPFSSSSFPSDCPWTTSGVAWNPPPETADGTHEYTESPEIKTIIQELLDSYTYTGTQAMAFYWRVESTATWWRNYDGYGLPGTPTLRIEYRKYADPEPTISVGSEDGWSRRAPVTINNLGSGLTDYQVKVDVTYDTDMQSDFDDIRFVDSDDSTPLSHWREDYTALASATFWVKVPSIPSGNKTIYLYYGNDAASSASDGDATFIFFDDFDDASLGAAWTFTQIGGAIGSYAESGTVIRLTGTNTGDLWGSSDKFLFLSISGNYDNVVVESYTTAWGGSHQTWSKMGGVQLRQGIDAGSKNRIMSPVFSATGATNSYRLTTGGITAEQITTTCPKYNRVSRTGGASGAWYSTDGITWTELGSQISFTGGLTDPVYLGIHLAGLSSAEHWVEVDWFRVRKYPPPSAYISSGSIASQVLNTGADGARWDALFWDETLPSNTDITFKARANDIPFAKDAASPPWTPVGETSPVTSGLPSGRYMQWQATLTTSDPSQTPTLHEVRVYYSDY